MTCLDNDVINELREILGDDLGAVADEFINQFHDLFLPLQAACKAADWSEAARLAHLLKGSAGNLGVRALASELLTLEQAAGAEQAETASQALDRVDQLAPGCIAELVAHGLSPEANSLTAQQ